MGLPALRGLAVTEGTHPGGSTLPWHEHAGATICCVLRGGFVEGYRGHEVECAAGLVKTTPAGERHFNRFDRGDAWGILIEVPSEYAAELRGYTTALDERRQVRDSSTAALGFRIGRELRSRDTAAPLALEGLVLELIAALGRAQPVRIAKPAPAWLGDVREMLHDRLADALQIGELAGAVGVHPVTVARTFRRTFGCTIGEYRRRLRLERAAAQLVNSEIPLAQIALAAGFADQSHFSNLFRRRLGISPSNYRRVFRDDLRRRHPTAPSPGS
jgi:AraC family transcriptional regulator